MPIRTPFKDILEGGHEFFILERRLRKKGKPDCPVSRMKTVRDDEWSYVGTSVRLSIYGDLGHPEDEMHSVWSVTGYHGWWNVDYGLRALVAARKADSKGRFDYKDGYNHKTDSVRYEWRLTRVRLAKETEVVNEKAAQKKRGA